MKLKLIQMPFIERLDNGYDFNASSLLPFSIATLAASLRNNGFYVDVDDLNIKVHRDKAVNLKIFFNLRRCINYIDGKEDLELERVIELVLGKTQLEGHDIFLLSYVRSLNPGTNGMFLCFNYYIKKTFKKLIIAGGLGTVNRNYDFLNLLSRKKDLLDYIIIGRGESSIIKLVKAIRDKTSDDNIEGLIYSKGKFIHNEIRREYNMMTQFNLHIEPDFEGLPIDFYKRKIREKNIFIIPLKLNVGCAYSCAFCWESGYHKKNNKVTDPKIAVELIKSLKEKYKTPFFSFLDDTFNTSKKFVEDFCHEIINSDLKIYWNDSARLDRHIFTDDVIALMRKAGCIHLVFGLESASQRMLDFIRKRVPLENASAILKKTSEVGIWNGINLIAGLPYEKEEDIDNTIEFVNSHENFIDECYYNAFYLLKESSFYLNPSEYGLENIHRLSSKNLERWNKHFDPRSFSYSFDESNGLKWPEKLMQINHSYHKLRSNIKIKQILPPHNHFPVLFYLYSKYADKSQIKREYFRIKKGMLLKLIMKPNFVYRHIVSSYNLHLDKIFPQKKLLN